MLARSRSALAKIVEIFVSHSLHIFCFTCLLHRLVAFCIWRICCTYLCSSATSLINPPSLFLSKWPFCVTNCQRNPLQHEFGHLPFFNTLAANYNIESGPFVSLIACRTPQRKPPIGGRPTQL